MAPGESVSRASLALHARLERLVVGHADHVVCVTDRHTALMRQTYGDLPAATFATIPNGYAAEEFAAPDGEGRDPGRDRAGQLAITYTGSLYIWRDLSPLLRALRVLIDAGELRADDVVLNMVGRCEEALGRPVAEVARDFGLEGVVRLRGQVSRPEALRFMRAADILLVLAENLTMQVPGKTYEYLGAGKPILALTGDGATADLVRETGAGEVVAPTDVDGLVAALRRQLARRRAGEAQGEPSLRRRFDRRTLTGGFATLFGAPRAARTLA